MKSDEDDEGGLKSEAETEAVTTPENDPVKSFDAPPPSLLPPPSSSLPRRPDATAFAGNDDDADQQHPEGSQDDEESNGGGEGEKGEEEGNGGHDDDWKVQRDAEKQLGDDSFRKGDFRGAIRHYTSALSVDPSHVVLLSNRSAAYLKLGERSRALHDAQECVRLSEKEDQQQRPKPSSSKGSCAPVLFLKGYSRLAAALQSLGRYQAALENWNVVLRNDPTNTAAREGLKTCKDQFQNQARDGDAGKEEPADSTVSAMNQKSGNEAEEEGGDGSDDDLDDFFNEVEEAAVEVVKERQQLAAESEKQVATNAIKHNRRDLGTAENQIGRILASNYKWKNLNPFYVLDVPHTASNDDISRRYKALSLLLHPDKNPNNNARAKEAYDEVLKAKAVLDDDIKYHHARQLVEQGMKQGRAEWERHHQKRGATAPAAAKGKDASSSSSPPLSLEEYQSRAVQRIFAEIEHSRREVEQRERNHELRERQKEEEELERQRNERKFDRNWKQEDRVEKRIGNWRNFSSKAKKSKP
jgi:tetratricopeptide (TPR) repeat protein